MIGKKNHFVALYKPVYQSFERFCKARAYGKMHFKGLMQETLLIAYSKQDQYSVVVEQELLSLPVTWM